MTPNADLLCIEHGNRLEAVRGAQQRMEVEVASIHRILEGLAGAIRDGALAAAAESREGAALQQQLLASLHELRLHQGRLLEAMDEMRHAPGLEEKLDETLDLARRIAGLDPGEGGMLLPLQAAMRDELALLREVAGRDPDGRPLPLLDRGLRILGQTVLYAVATAAVIALYAALFRWLPFQANQVHDPVPRASSTP